MFPAFRAALAVVAIGSSLSPLPAQTIPGNPIDTTLALRYFAEAAEVARRDGGALWGVPFDGALMFGDQKSRAVVAERGDTSGVLRRVGSVWIGTMPSDRNVSNTAQEWGGVRWTTLLWPPPSGDDAESRARRAELFAHELWHGIQERAGLPVQDPVNAHLDEREARLWLRLEARALVAALDAKGAARRGALRDALEFRRARQARFEASAEAERQLERHEGMASYTGLRLAGRDSAGTSARLHELLAHLDTAENLGRSFAYSTGPAYGALLDELEPGWRKAIVGGAGPAELLRDALEGGADASAAHGDPVQRAQVYGYDGIAAAELARERTRQARKAELTGLLVDGRVIRLPFGQMQMQIDPNGAEPLDTLGTVYRGIRISDRWGVLDAKDGAVLLAADFSHAAIPRPESVATGAAGVVRGKGWTLTLAEGYRLMEGPRAGDLKAGR